MTVNDLNIEVEYKPIKHIHLSVYPPDGHVHVSAPKGTSEDQLRMFILSKWVWIDGKRSLAISNNIQPARKYVSGEAHYFKGQLYRLKVDQNSGNILSVAIEGDYIVVRCHRQSQAEDLMKQWYRNNLKDMLEPMVERWAAILGIPEPTYEVLAMQKRWGSCNKGKRTIMFNPELVKKPPQCIEYIVAHEMIHLIERNHTDRFFRLLDTHLPGWENLRKELNEFPITL